MSFGEFFNATAALGTSYGEGLEENRRRGALSKLGQQLGAGDYAGAASTAFDAGDAATGIKLLGLGNEARKEALAQQASQAFASGLGALYGGGGGSGLAPLGQGPAGGGGQAGKLPAFAGGASAMALPPDGGAISNRFVGALKAGGLTNPYGLAAVAAYAQRESGYSPRNITGSWSDPSESGQAGTSGGILSWRGDRLANMRRMTAGAADPVTAQAQFTLTENPQLTLALQNARSPEEANNLMANAWRFAGFNRGGGEYQARLDGTRAWLARVNGGAGQDAPPAARTQVASADGSFVQGTNPARPPMRLPTSPATSDDPRSDMPEEGAREAAFYVPGTNPQAPGAGFRALPSFDENATPPGRRPPFPPISRGGLVPGGSPGGAMTLPPEVSGVPAGAPPALPALGGASAPVPGPMAQAQTIRNVPVQAIAQASPDRSIGFLIGAAASPNLPDGQRQIALTLLKQKLDETSLPADVKEYRFAQAQGFTGSLVDYKNALRAPLTPTILSQGQSAIAPGERSPFYTNPAKPDRDAGEKLTSEIEARRAAAPSLGLVEGTPAHQMFVGTGQLPKGDRQEPSVFEKKAINDSEEQVLNLDSAISTLNRAKELNYKTYTGTGAKILGNVGTSFPGSSIVLDDKKASATREFGQIMSMEAIRAMSQTLKGATTDAEMARFMEILGDPTTPPPIRERTINRMVRLAENQRELATARLNEMRGGTYYRPGGGNSDPALSQRGAPRRAAPQGAAPSLGDLEAEARRRGLIQ